jgi:hypothetical protein
MYITGMTRDVGRMHSPALGRHVVSRQTTCRAHHEPDRSHVRGGTDPWWVRTYSGSEYAYMRPGTTLRKRYGDGIGTVRLGSSAADGHGTHAVAVCLEVESQWVYSVIYVYGARKATAFEVGHDVRAIAFDPRGDLVVLSDMRIGYLSLRAVWALSVMRMRDGPADVAMLKNKTL